MHGKKYLIKYFHWSYVFIICILHKMANHKNPEIPHSRIILRYFQYSLICFLFLISLCFSQTEYEDLIKKVLEYQLQGNYDAAILAYKKAHKINVDFTGNKLDVIEKKADYYGGLGYLYLKNDQLSEANNYLLQAIRENPRGKNYYYNLACLNFRKNNNEIGLEFLEKAFHNGYKYYEKLSENEDLDNIRKTKQYRILYKKYFSEKDIESINLANRADRLHEKKNYNSAAKLFVQSAKLENNSNVISFYSVADLYGKAGFSYLLAKKPKSAIKYLNISNDYYQKGKDNSLYSMAMLAINYSAIGIGYSFLNNNKLSLENKLIAMDYHIQLGDSVQIASSAENIAWIMEDKLKNGSEAAEYYLLALNHGYGKEEFSYSVANAYMQIVKNYVVNNELDKAVLWGEKGYMHAIDIAEPEFVSGFELLLGMFLILYRPTEGIPYLERAIDWSEKEQNALIDGEDGNNRLFMHHFLNRAYMTIGDKDKVDENRKRALDYIANRKGQSVFLPLAYYFQAQQYYTNNNYDQAILYYNNALENSADLEEGQQHLRVEILSDLGGIYSMQKNYKKALKIQSDIFEIANEYEDAFSFPQTAHLLGILIGKDSENNELLEESLISFIKLTENIINNDIPHTIYVSEYIDNMLFYYELLVTIKILQNDHEAAAFYIDVTKNKSLKKKLSYLVENSKPELEEVELNEDELFLLIEEINSNYHWQIKSAQRFEGFMGIDSATTTNELDQLFIYMFTNDSTYSDFFMKDSSLFNPNIPDLKTLAKIYLQEIKYSQGNSKKTVQLSKKLYNALINNFSNKINKRKIIIAPDPIISNIPFEALLDKEGRYLVESYDISYVQSESVLALLQKRKYNNLNNRLLAFGGVDYSVKDYNTISDHDIELSKNFRSDYSVNDIIGSLGYSDWESLPGSLKEVKAIKNILPSSDLIIGRDASESHVKSLSISGKLKNYNIIHFATHGVVIPGMPKLSSIVLSSSKDKSEDGYLTVNEISQLETNADFINLSACETGLGKVHAGDGVIGLTQAFMEAGANGVCVSLWPVEDQSTAIFMTSVYAKIADGFSYSFAITDTKRDFISGKYGEEYKKPYYWAPFVYYGK